MKSDAQHQDGGAIAFKEWLAALRLAVAEQRAARAEYDARDKTTLVGSALEMEMLFKIDEKTRAVSRAAEGMVDASNDQDQRPGESPKLS